MDITPVISKDANIIDAYSQNYVKIAKQKYYSNLLVNIDKIKEVDFENLAELNFQLVSEFITDENIIFIVGLRQMQLLPEQVKFAFLKNNINIEIMNYAAACNTYNILVAENRNVNLLLLN